MADILLARGPDGRGRGLDRTSGVSQEPTTPLRRLLLATDLSTASGRATDEAVALARRNRASLVVLSVVDPRRLRLPGGRFVRRADQEHNELLDGVQGIVARARAVGVDATFLVWEGDPAETIMAAARSEDVDAIVMGSHGRGRVGRMLLGSTSTRVSADADRRVIVVPS